MLSRFIKSLALCAGLVPAGAATGATIEWEITNRFAPFEALGNAQVADQLFDIYRVRPEDGGLAGWHARLDRSLMGGMTSPYAAFLERDRPLFWDPEAGGHREALLKYVRKEDAQTLRVALSLAPDEDETLAGGECWWSFNNGPTPCNSIVRVDVPLSARTEVAVITPGGVVTTVIAPKHTVIVGMGDSYGSGEGNPDVPARWRGVTPPRGHEWLSNPDFRFPLPARTWIDNRCHRSFFSYQNLAALKIASDDPHRFVTFLHYACSGAEVFDGLLAPQYQAWDKNPFVPYSQVNAAVRELCTTDVERRGSARRSEYQDITREELGGIDITAFERRPYSAAVGLFPTELRQNDRLDSFFRESRSKTGKDYPSTGMMSCPKGKLRTPDAVFLSIGGNDIGFADLVKYALLPSRYDNALIAFFSLPAVCPPPGQRVDPVLYPTVAQHCDRQDMLRRPHAGGLIEGVRGKGGVGERLTLAYNVLQYRLGIEPEAIIQTQYPDPLRVLPSAAPPCGPLDTSRAVVYGAPDGPDPFSAWEGLKIGAPFGVASGWTFNLTSAEGHRTLAVFDQLRVALARAAKAEGISIVCETRDAFIGHGWWRGGQLNLPNAGEPDDPRRWDADLWAPYAYNPRDRAIRTGNDSAMTQPDPASAIAGAVHPNLTGQRLMAERVVARFEEEMQKRDAFDPARVGDILKGLGEAFGQ